MDRGYLASETRYNLCAQIGTYQRLGEADLDNGEGSKHICPQS